METTMEEMGAQLGAMWRTISTQQTTSQDGSVHPETMLLLITVTSGVAMEEEQTIQTSSCPDETCSNSWSGPVMMVTPSLEKGVMTTVE